MLVYSYKRILHNDENGLELYARTWMNLTNRLLKKGTGYEIMNTV